MSQKSVEEQVSDVVSEILRSSELDEAFSSVLLHSAYKDRRNSKVHEEKLRNLWQSSPESQDIILRQYLLCLYEQKSGARVAVLCSLLESLVEYNVVPARAICEALLTFDQFSYTNPMQWKACLSLVRRIIGGVDYKGARDLLRMLLEKGQTIPYPGNIANLPLVEAVNSVLSYILDRNACLLPAYFAVNEITKLWTDSSQWPSWLMGKGLTDFVDSFKPAAQMVSTIGRSHLLPVVGHSLSGLSGNNVWRLNTTTLRFHLNGPLPYSKELQEQQQGLLRYVLEQPYSREMVCNMLGLNKQAKLRCEVLEEQLVDLVVLAMERSETEDPGTDDGGLSQLLWQHLSSQLIYFVLFQFASFPHMVQSLFEKLQGKNLKKGRDHLMWVLLQFISGSIQKNPLGDFLPVMQLYDLLYSDSDVLPVPDFSKASSAHALAPTCIWIHLNRKAETDNVPLLRPIPLTLKEHQEFLEQSVSTSKTASLSLNDFKIALLCNAYSTNTMHFGVPMGMMLESVYGNLNMKSTTLLPGNIVAAAPTMPLPMSLLDSLTVHAKMSLIHSIVSRVIRLAKAKTGMALAPALVETYCRLLVYMEIESLGIKGFISQLLPTVFNSCAWGILHTLLEMFSYRLHHTQLHYRVQLLSHLHTLATIQQTNQNQLHLCVESTALRLIISLGSTEVQPNFSRMASESKNQAFLAGDSEELNRVLVLTLARAMYITGSDTVSTSWCRDILASIMNATPHCWPSHTLACFPPIIREFYEHSPVSKDKNAQLKRTVEEEYKKWKNMSNENDIIAHFSMQGIPPLFICIIFKSLIEENRVSPTAYKVLDRLGPRALSVHLRTFADYLGCEFTLLTNNSSSSTITFTKYVEALNDLVWKCNIVPIDRLILCLMLRTLEGKEAQIRFLVIQMLLVQKTEFKSRVTDFVRENSPEHWLQSNWHDKHMAFHKKYPEKFYYEGIQDLNSQVHQQYLPVYFGNVCLRFLPVMDVLVHRLLELPQVHKVLETLLEHIGCLYKFHDRPVTYLYNTLFYYEAQLKAKPMLKRKLVSAIVGAFNEIRQPKWCLSEEYTTYMTSGSEENAWTPEQSYYVSLVERLVSTIEGKPPYYNCDWRFNEFPNPAAHALHSICVELMALPVNSATVGHALLSVVLDGSGQVPRESIMSWMNAIGLIITALPESYWTTLNDCIMEVMKSPQLTNPDPDSNPFAEFNFAACYEVYSEQPSTVLLALCHAIWHHAGIGQLIQLPQFVREQVRPVIKTETQFLYLCHLVGPFLQRLHQERTRYLLELTVELYEALATVDRNCDHLHYMDPISDFLYHIKYMYVGDGVKGEVEKVIRNLRSPLQLRLRFISHITKIEDATTPT